MTSVCQGTEQEDMRDAAGNRPVVLLLSGGIDSVTALHMVNRADDIVAALSFDYGSKHNARELPCAEWQAGVLGIRHITITLVEAFRHIHSTLMLSGGAVPDGHYAEENMRQTVVPFRNGIMLSIAAGVAESLDAKGIVIAAHTGDHTIYPDCRECFMEAMGSAIRLGTYAGVEIVRPFIAMTKAGIVARGAELGVDYGRTWSCYKGGVMHCGTCGTCVERREAFLLAGVADPTEYQCADALPLSPGEREAGVGTAC